MMNILFAIMTNRLLWGFVGITALSFIIWVIGPVFSIVDSRPLEPEVNRQISIVLLYIAWGLSNLVPRLYNAWLNRKLMGSLKNDTNASGNPDRKRLTNEDRVLSERFTEAAEMLKKAHFSRAGNHRWMQRFSRQYLYQLPWYVIIGAPGAGKTTALVNSGLQFPLADRFGKAALRGIGGTRNCDWWFTNEAVLLDTAGRYTTQESEQQQDASEWNNFVGLLRKYRGRQPINGVIVTVSVSDLLTQSAQTSREQALSLRQRLMELHEQLGIRFPVYVMVTKTDLLKGFRPTSLNLIRRSAIRYGASPSRGSDPNRRISICKALSSRNMPCCNSVWTPGYRTRCCRKAMRKPARKAFCFLRNLPPCVRCSRTIWTRCLPDPTLKPSSRREAFTLPAVSRKVCHLTA